MSTPIVAVNKKSEPTRLHHHPADPCTLVIFGASGDLTRRLLMPAIFNLFCDGLLSERFAIVGVAMDDLSSEVFREKMTGYIKQFGTRPKFDEAAWTRFVPRLSYISGKFDDLATFERLKSALKGVEEKFGTQGNIVFYMATPPSVFGLVSDQLTKAGFKERGQGFQRIIAEKPFGTDLASAVALNKEMLAHWKESQIYRIDHYLGKETVQNILSFRFSNGIFEPLWNKEHVDHIQFTVSETVGVEGRGGYYDSAGVMRDMMQNHMFQMLAYLCMEPPSSFRADAVRNEKVKVLEAIRLMRPEDVPLNTVRGQYGAGTKPDGSAAVAYRDEPSVSKTSKTETFAAVKLHIDNWRWVGVPIYLRSGKALWKRGTEILVQFKKAPEVIFKGTPGVDKLSSNQLIFHIQPDQGIELRFHAKLPGPGMALQKVDMRFDYRDSFEASRGTGYEVLLYNTIIGDATLFSRSDLVECAWRIAQPILDAWAATPAPEFPNYGAGSWGPRTAFELIERDGRKWLEVISRAVLEQVPLLCHGTPAFLHALALMLKPQVVAPGATIIQKGDPGLEMYIVARGKVEIVGADGKVLATLKEGDYFGETALLSSDVRTATVRAVTPCDLFVLEKTDFNQVLQDHPDIAETLQKIAAGHTDGPAASA